MAGWEEWGEWEAEWGGGRGGMGNPGSGVSSQEWDRLAENPKFLRIDQRSDQLVVIDDADRAQTFYPDGKKHNDKDADGNKDLDQGLMGRRRLYR